MPQRPRSRPLCYSGFPKPLTASAAERTAIWDHAGRVAADAAARIRVLAGTDPAGAADAAWAASDTLHAAAAALGSRTLRRAADAYGRAARAPFGRVPARSPAGDRLRQSARLLGALAYLSRDPVNLPLVLIVQLAALAEAVADLREAQRHAAQAAADLRQLLAGTGMLMAEGTDLRFTHHTLAEFLAVRATAGRMTADLTGQPDLKTLIDQGLAPAQETFAVFTLVLWGRAGGDLNGLLRHLLDGPPRQSLLAGLILGECGDTLPAEAPQVIDRLMDMALGDASVLFRDDFYGDDLLHRRGEQAPDPLAAEPGKAFWLLGRIHGDPHVATVLRGVAASGELATETRTDAAVALGRNSDRDGAIEILRSLPEDHTPPDI